MQTGGSLIHTSAECSLSALLNPSEGGNANETDQWSKSLVTGGNSDWEKGWEDKRQMRCVIVFHCIANPYVWGGCPETNVIS